MIEEVLALAREYMKTIAGHYYQSEVLYELGISSYRDGDAVVSKLKQWLRFEALLTDGKISPGQLFKPEWSGA